MKIVWGLLGLAAVVFALAACGGSNDSTTQTPNPSKETTATQIAVSVKEFSISPTPTSAKAGEVRFTVKNDGTVPHEFVVIKTDSAPASLPVYQASDKVAEGHAVGDVNEDKVTSAGELEDVAPGATKDATFKLGAGKYVLICNLPAHYGQGMRTAFVVN
jgi:uncharacterized cupredoxin-like copper-binding protein